MTLEQFYQICDSIQPDHNGCLNYPTSSPTSYVTIDIDGHPARVHRLALERKITRPIRRYCFAAHTCSNKACVNPAHLSEDMHHETKSSLRVLAREAWDAYQKDRPN
jgi:hypothetical protein